MGIKLILHQKNIASKSLILKNGQKIRDPYYPLAEDKNKDMEYGANPEKLARSHNGVSITEKVSV